MSNLMIGIKRFFTNKNTVTIVAVIASVGILYLFYSSRIEKATKPVSVPYATVEIGPRTLITEDMVSIRKVPGDQIGKSSDVVRSKLNIVGQYVIPTTVIPKGSLFYKSMLTSDWSSIKSSLYDDIPENHTLVSLSVNIETTYGNSIYPDNVIDLYFVTIEKGKLLLGKFIEGIRVRGVINSAGENVFEQTTASTGSPAYLVFDVDEELYLLLQKASYLPGTIFPVPRNKAYSDQEVRTRIASSYIQQHIMSQTVDVNSHEEKLNGGVSIFDQNALLGGK